MYFTITEDGSTEEFVAHEGSAFLQMDGDFGGGTLTLEIKVLGTDNWQPFEDGDWTAGPVSRLLSAPPGQPLRLTMDGATDPDVSGFIESAPLVRQAVTE